ncbi:putative permease [Planococcus donghaensis MPA1U2]|uniref:Putative permease n=2 Tax=Planococcus donghaensis TaxID=414778 RepID=E7REP1_9BACL|nr:putative permease [Planococcus donghaensis MPA1U2]
MGELMKRNAKQEAMMKSYADSPEKFKRLYRRTLWIVALAQIFAGVGLTAGVTVAALLASDMLGTDRYAGVPVVFFTIGSAGAALIIGRLSQRFSRRVGLASGFLAGAIGALGVVGAALSNNIFLLFVSLVIYGAGMATNLQARYAGTDLATVKQRGTAISVALVSLTLGAFAGPNLVGVMGSFAESINIPSLAGPFILAAAAFSIAGLVILILLRPDPLQVSKALAAHLQTVEESSEVVKEDDPAIDRKGVILGATVMVLTQLIMVAIMTMTPIHMGHYGHDLGDIGLVISIHVVAMYLPSIVTGILVDKLGRIFMTVAAGVTFMAAGLVAALGPSESIIGLMFALGLLGLGWNFGFISGTTLVVDSTDPTMRAKTQGTVDVLIALAGATGGGLSGMIMAQSSFAAMSLGGGILALALIPAVLWSTKKTLA